MGTTALRGGEGLTLLRDARFAWRSLIRTPGYAAVFVLTLGLGIGANTVKVSGEQRAAIVAAPSYFDSHPKPRTPRDLTAHRCINYRMGAGGVYRWEFEKRGKPVTVLVSGPLIVDDVELVVRAALDGLGLAFLFEEPAARHIARGEFVRVLEDLDDVRHGSRAPGLHQPPDRHQRYDPARPQDDRRLHLMKVPQRTN